MPKRASRSTSRSSWLVDQPPPYVSRGGEKLAHGLDALGVEVAGRDALDVGASTGGFTDVLLQRGAARVIALDVGHGQLHPRIRDDDRVVVLERVNARELSQLPFAPDLVTCDVSFISVRDRAAARSASRCRGLGGARARQAPIRGGARRSAKGGVIRDREVHARVLREVAEAALEWERDASPAS